MSEKEPGLGWTQLFLVLYGIAIGLLLAATITRCAPAQKAAALRQAAGERGEG